MSTNIKLPGMNTFPLENHFQICSFNITTQKKQRYFKPLIFANVSLILPCSVARPSHLVSPHANFLLYLVLPPTSWTILSPTSLYLLVEDWWHEVHIWLQHLFCVAFMSRPPLLFICVQIARLLVSPSLYILSILRSPVVLPDFPYLPLRLRCHLGSSLMTVAFIGWFWITSFFLFVLVIDHLWHSESLVPSQGQPIFTNFGIKSHANAKSSFYSFNSHNEYK